jgi:hypothetical protein
MSEDSEIVPDSTKFVPPPPPAVHSLRESLMAELRALLPTSSGKTFKG